MTSTPTQTAMHRSQASLTARLRDAWVAPQPAAAGGGAFGGCGAWRSVGNAFAWPLAILLIVHRVVALAFPGKRTDDFTTVWSAARRFVERVPVYNENYSHVDPHYLYNPGATLLLSPVGVFADADTVRPLFIIANAFAIICAIAWLTRLSGYGPSSPVFPVALALAFMTEAVTNTLVFSNVNGILLLALVAFLAWMVQGRTVAAGVVLGLAILVKPMFAPLLVLPLMRVNFTTVAAGVAVPVLFNVLAWPLTPGAKDYTDIVVPYLGITRDYANSSLAGVAVYFGMPGWLHGLLFVIIAAAVAVAVAGLARWRYSDEWLWATVSAGVLITGVCLLSSLGQAYYSMMLFPALFTVLRPASPFHTPIPWLGAFLCLVPLTTSVGAHPIAHQWMATYLPTAGWAIIIISIATWVVVSSITQRHEDEGHNRV
ncbi:glycosyltransferase family 87 protein [Corynebacterium aquatimens]|uniref:Arabinofuranan 3-O-arabinosyltransferase n=1 Tax=Corynebacterium aquatimens TaxID=1190508 RepID=A0A931GVV2_9CORY|nr:glycosyltransferase family 87 protein [Corynebacterium aquatimens]MBG6121741.1 arabinofuranan 3-O-arabinosyltransferase [Corynebacterium aquatimens]